MLDVRVVRLVARAIGWLFAADIAYHAVLAAIDSAHDAGDGNWAAAVGLFAIALIAAAIVIVALVAATRSLTRSGSRSPARRVDVDARPADAQD